MKDLNFQIKDDVYSLLYGNGVVVDVANGDFPIIVAFKSGMTERFTRKGARLTADSHRMLYHGHNLKITVNEKEPVRSRWCNIYDGIYHPSVGTIGDRIYTSRKEALENIMEDSSLTYIRTIELVPKDEF